MAMRRSWGRVEIYLGSWRSCCDLLLDIAFLFLALKRPTDPSDFALRLWETLKRWNKTDRVRRGARRAVFTRLFLFLRHWLFNSVWEVKRREWDDSMPRRKQQAPRRSSGKWCMHVLCASIKNAVVIYMLCLNCNAMCFKSSPISYL